MKTLQVDDIAIQMTRAEAQEILEALQSRREREYANLDIFMATLDQALNEVPF